MDNLIWRQDAVDALGERPLTWTQDEYLRGLQNQYDSDLEAIQNVLPAQPEQAIKDCRNCKHGKYNDYHNTYFCYNTEDCSNWDKWEPSAQQWILCKERMPEERGFYLVSGNGKVWICEMIILMETKGWANSIANPTVAAWRPLPEPWKESEVNNG